MELAGAFAPVQRPRYGLSGAESSSLADPTPFGPGARFAGDTTQGAVQLWCTDGTYAGTRAVQSFGPSGAVTLGGITTPGRGRAVFEVGA